MKKFSIIAGLIMALLTSSAQAHNSGYEALPNYDRFGVGFTAGPTSGLGPAFRFKANHAIGVQLSFLPYHDGHNTVFSGGAQIMLTLHEGTNAEAFLSFGAAIIHIRQTHPVDIDTTFSFGPGVGVRWTGDSGIGMTIELPLCLIFQSNQPMKVLPIPNLSFMYYF